MKYRNKPLFPYADGKYAVMPADLPARFYPEEPERTYRIGDLVVCFNADVDDEIKERLIADYTEYYEKQIKKYGYFQD